MKWFAILALIVGLGVGVVVLVPQLADDVSEELGGELRLRSGAADAADQVTLRALQAAQDAGELTAEAVDDINRRFARECLNKSVLYADAGIAFRYTEGLLRGGIWRPEPKCEAVVL